MLQQRQPYQNVDLIDVFLCLFGTVVLLLVFGRDVVLQLGHAVSKSGALLPTLVGISSSRCVERSVVLENSSLLDVPLVVGFLLGGVRSTDLLVLGGAESGRNVRVGSELGRAQL